MSDTVEFDLDAYLRHIGWEGPRRTDLETLRGIHLAHILSIPFENLDPLAGRTPSLKPADITAKLLHSRRGGYCYEHNTLLWTALRSLGFEVTGLAGRVLVGTEYGRGGGRPRTHMALLVRVPGDETPYLADVGFGSTGALLEAVPLVADREFRSGPRRHRLVSGPEQGPSPTWVLQAYEQDRWSDQYAFTLDVFERSDYEVFNWFVGAHPRSPFTRRAYVVRTTADGHLMLFDSVLTESGADGSVTERKLTDEREARRIVEERFGITPPEDVTLLT
jgi:N-hydroxyarylamine O-acetyltransferase